MPINVGVAYVDVRPDLSGFGTEVKQRLNRDLSAAGTDASRSMQRSLGGTSGIMSKFNTEIGASAIALKAGLAGAAAIAGSRVITFGRDAIQAASALNEQISGSVVVFGEFADEVQQFAQTTALSFGISERAALQAANSIGGLLTAIGATPESAAGASQTLVALAADVASLRDVAGGTDEVLEKVRSGLVGEYEPLRAVGIMLNEAAVSSKAAEIGLGGANRELTEGEKVAARYALIVEGMSVAEGDMARTSESLANRQRVLNARLEETKARLGTDLLPAATAATTTLIGLDEVVRDLSEGISNNLGGALDDIKEKVPGGGLLGGLLGDVAQRVTVPSTLVIEWLHDVGTEATSAGTGFSGFLDNIKLGAGIIQAAEKDLDRMRKSVFGLADAEDALEDASRGLVRAEGTLADARRAYNELLAEGAVDEEEVADARQSLAAATRSLAAATRDLADVQQDYDEALARFNITGLDTDQEKLADAADNLADASDRVTSASEAEADAATELQAAQAGDPEFQHRLADAKAGVADAEEGVADARDNVSEATYKLNEATIANNTLVAANADAVAKVRTEWEQLLAKEPAISAFLSGPLSLLPDSAGGGDFGGTPGSPVAAPQAVYAPGGNTPASVNNVTVNVTQTDPDPQHVAREIMWAMP